MGININKVIFYESKVIRNTTRLFHSQPIEPNALIQESIFPGRTVIEYIKATEKIVISYLKHKIVTTQTVSIYVKQTLKVAGINTSLFTAHSTRHSNSSKKFMKELPLTDIVKKRGWKSTSTFTKFYNLPILNN